MHITSHGKKPTGFTHITIMVCEYTSVHGLYIINIYIIICSFNIKLGDIMNGVAALFTLCLK